MDPDSDGDGIPDATMLPAESARDVLLPLSYGEAPDWTPEMAKECALEAGASPEAAEAAKAAAETALADGATNLEAAAAGAAAAEATQKTLGPSAATIGGLDFSAPAQFAADCAKDACGESPEAAAFGEDHDTMMEMAGIAAGKAYTNCEEVRAPLRGNPRQWPRSTPRQHSLAVGGRFG